MQLEHEKQDTPIFVKHYKSSELTLSQQTFSHSVIITPEKIINNNWGIKSIDELNLDTIEALIELDAHIYLLGTGATSQIPPQEIIIAFARLGKSIDFMDSAAACRTFNILANEGRRVAAAIIV
ncbi:MULTISPECIES: Mth938-like domain-containing protein [Cysteiniphilum]|uniref:Membrane protein n=1 Tax=Cysteiniphilum litorale TaxID=2056700 RepID=A0A8J3E820_9GAMM|nr:MULTISPECIES: MTH938/NDUFAF3 family protein [Cysteiniphilum]GGF89967.1 membrane protein [Cysteiniphilum litorale]